MSKVVDITEKLNYEENPKVKIRDKELEVNADAATVLKIMGVLGNDGSGLGAGEVLAMYELMFEEKEREKIDSLKLNFTDFRTLVFTAISLITGDDPHGEQ